MIEYSIDYQSPEDAWLTGMASSTIYLEMNSWNVDYLDWQLNVGRDQEHGAWHMVGWAMGLYLVKLASWDSKLVHDDNTVAELWASVMDDNPEMVLERIAEPLRELGLSVVFLDSDQSQFIKRFAEPPTTLGIASR